MKLRTHRINHLNYLEPLISVVFWILMLASPLLFGRFDDGIDWAYILSIWRSFLPFLGLYLLNRFVFLPLFFFRGRRWLFFASNLLLILAAAAMVHIIQPEIWLPERKGIPAESMAAGQTTPPGGLQPGERPPGHPPPGERPPRSTPPGPGKRPPGQEPFRTLPPFLSFVAISVLIIGFDTGLLISVKWAQSEQKRIRAEKENMESQLAFLQNQVSPHFFMNTLNNIHSLIDIDTDEAKESIIKLSRLMRHLLYDSQVERIPLKKEIEFIQDYVELMRLRFSDKVKIHLQIPEQLPDKSIPPLLYTSFVENAFKHGISYQEKSFIDISFSNGSNQLSFVIKNSNPALKKEEGPSGIGIENARKRLDLIYGDAYSLDIDDSKDAFTVNLKIPV